MTFSYLVIWQKSHAHDIGVLDGQTFKPSPYDPTAVTRQETPIDVEFYDETMLTAQVKYNAILITLQKLINYPSDNIIIHGIYKL